MIWIRDAKRVTEVATCVAIQKLWCNHYARFCIGHETTSITKLECKLFLSNKHIYDHMNMPRQSKIGKNVEGVIRDKSSGDRLWPRLGYLQEENLYPWSTLRVGAGNFTYTVRCYFVNITMLSLWEDFTRKSLAGANIYAGKKVMFVEWAQL